MLVAVCDDIENHLSAAASTIADYASAAGRDFEILTYTTVEQLLDESRVRPPDILFLDIEFDGNPLGIDAARSMNEVAPDCQVVFLTNYLHYAVDVYQSDHVWYMLKEQLADRLPELFDKLDNLASARRANIVVQTRGESALTSIPCESIRFIERRGRLTYITTPDAIFETPEKLKEIEDKLPPKTFALCHSSFIVNTPHVRAIKALEIDMDDGSRVPVSRRYAKTFRERYLAWAESWTL